MTFSEASEKDRAYSPGTSGASGFALSWYGVFLDPELEQAYREEVWPVRIRQQGSLCGIVAVFFLLAGIGPMVDLGLTPLVIFLSIFRLLVSCVGGAVFYSTRKKTCCTLYPIFLVLFILCTGVYEAIEAVLTYAPNLEFSTPFTLLIIFLCYILFPLRLKFIVAPALFSSLIYVLGLGVFAVAQWSDLIQLSLFFIAANLLGIYSLVRIARFDRKQFTYIRHVLKLNARLQAEIDAKNIAYSKLEELSVLDALTQVANRRKFMETAQREWAVAQRYEQALSMMIIDVDHFKQVNDTYGHSVGDEVLKEIAGRMKRELREADLLARLGGEEFGVILPNTDADHAVHLAERLRRVVAASPVQFQNHEIVVSISIGVARRIPDESDTFEKLFNRADSGMYLAKRNGRDQVQANC